MFVCMDLILNSYHCWLNEAAKIGASVSSLDTVSVNQKVGCKRFSFYVGAGNNANLIRSVLRKRHWWKEVDTPDKAHLVWTQLRILSTLQRCKKHEEDW